MYSIPALILGVIVGLTVPYTIYRIIILHQRRAERLDDLEIDVRSLKYTDRLNRDEWLQLMARVKALENIRKNQKEKK